VAAAREHAPAVVTAQASARVARALHVGARLAPIGNPYTEIVTDRGSRGVTQGATLTATLWLPLEPWGQRGKRISEADARVGWADTSVETVQAQAAAEAVRAYGAALVEAERKRLLEQILETSQQESALYRARVEAGDATEQDAAQAAVEVARNAVALAECRADLQKALADLARILGVNEVEPPETGLTLRPPQWAQPEAASDRAAQQAPAVKMLRKEAEFQGRSRERWAADARLPMMLMLSTGRGDLGEWRVGGGLALTLPFSRSNQGEQALADAERRRALTEAEVQRQATTSTLRGLERERQQIVAALSEIDAAMEPAGQAAVAAAVAVQKAGKGELLRVLTARRDLALLRTRRLEMIRREWNIISQRVALSGELP
jgi:cobalt-zinc-cadmium efflux system outer membrane protein